MSQLRISLPTNEATTTSHIAPQGILGLCWRLLAKWYTSDPAIDWIYTVYGWGKSKTKIMKLINKDLQQKVDRLWLGCLEDYFHVSRPEWGVIEWVVGTPLDPSLHSCGGLVSSLFICCKLGQTLCIVLSILCHCNKWCSQNKTILLMGDHMLFLKTKSIHPFFLHSLQQQQEYIAAWKILSTDSLLPECNNQLNVFMITFCILCWIFCEGVSSVSFMAMSVKNRC